MAALADTPPVRARKGPKSLTVVDTTAPLSPAQVEALVQAARDKYAAGDTPRIDLPDVLVNDLAMRAKAGDDLCREVVLYWSSKLIAPHPQHIHWMKYADAGPEDMWQEGRMLVLLAIEKYDASRGYDFGAYAARIVSNGLGEWAERHSLAVPATRNARRRLRREGVVDETTYRAKLAENLPRYLSTIIPSGDNGGDESKGDYGESVPERADDYDLEHEVLRSDLGTSVRDAFYRLDPLYQEVLYCRFVIPLSLEKTHRKLKIGIGTLRGLEEEALAHLHDALEDALA